MDAASLIPATSASYPARGAANETGISYALVLAWVDAETYAAARDVRDRIKAAHGDAAYGLLHTLITAAFNSRRLRVRRWAVYRNGWRS